MGRVEIRPGLDNGHNLAGGQIREGQVVRRREANYVALSRDRFSLEKAGRQRAVILLGFVLLLLFLDCAVVVDEDKGFCIAGVLGAICARVAGA